jgi:uncharacterized protein
LFLLFEQLDSAGLVALQNAGYTQSEGFTDCSELYRERGGRRARLQGFCWYTEQDRDGLKATGELHLAFWGAPKGQDPDMRRVGQLIVDIFRKAGYHVDWDGTGGSRPVVYLLSKMPLT